jgi:3-dehydrotetronate 4-kinase
MASSLGIIADDYTGALMVACYLEGRGIHAPLIFRPGTPPGDALVTVVGARTRATPSSEAVEEVSAFVEALARGGCERFVYKPSAGFDSSPSGNIGQIADYLADRVGSQAVLMAAGFPEYAITTHQGILFYRGKLVSESIKRFDPLTPMSDPNLVRFLSQQTREPLALVDHLTVHRGLDAIRTAVTSALRDGSRHVFLDVSDENDLDLVARYAAETPFVFVASDPVAVEYTRILLQGKGPRVPPPNHASGPAVVLCGTVGPVIERQMKLFAQSFPTISIDITDERPAEELARVTLDWADTNLGGQPFAISTSASAQEVQRAQSLMGTFGAARRAEAVLALVAKGLHSRGARRFVVAGGETSGSVVSALDVSSVRAFPEGPLGTGFCVTENEDPISFFLKPGKHGTDDILLRALEEMQR